ncbi:hypothetical protein ACEPAF_9901 [Sanghuangporus sanghuang]
MSGSYDKAPHAEVKPRSTDEARTFKKTDTVHGRPPVTDHDMHEDMMRDPPNNVPDGAVPGFITDGMKAPRKSDVEAEERGDPPLGLFEEEGVGRAKPFDVQTDLMDTSESTSRA